MSQSNQIFKRPSPTHDMCLNSWKNKREHDHCPSPLIEQNQKYYEMLKRNQEKRNINNLITQKPIKRKKETNKIFTETTTPRSKSYYKPIRLQSTIEFQNKTQDSDKYKQIRPDQKSKLDQYYIIQNQRQGQTKYPFKAPDSEITYKYLRPINYRGYGQPESIILIPPSSRNKTTLNQTIHQNIMSHNLSYKHSNNDKAMAKIMAKYQTSEFKLRHEFQYKREQLIELLIDRIQKQ